MSIIKELILYTVTLLVYALLSIFSLLIIERNGCFWFIKHFVEGRKVLWHIDFAFIHVPKYLHLTLVARIV